MMKKRTPASFRTLIAELAKDAKLPYWISVLVHIISNIQITYIIFQPTMNPLYDINLKVLKTLRIIGSYTVGFNIFDPPTDQTGLEVGWIITCAYLLILATISNIILLRCYFRKKVDPYLAQVMGIVHFIHSKIIFCPIHYFLVWFASSYSDCASGSTDTVCKFPFFVVSLVFIILNVALAVIAELFPRESKKPKDGFAMKNNILYRTILCHKIVLIIFELNIQDSKFVLSIFNFLVTLVYCYNILSSLPFYNIPVLKLNIIMSSTHFAFSLMLMIILFGVRPGYLEALSVILVVYITKIFLTYLNKALTRILGLGFRNPQEAAHCLVLLKDYTVRYANVTKLGEKYHRGSIYLHGLLKLYKVDTTTLAEFGTMGQYDLQLYGIVVRKLNELSKVYPKSEILTLLIAQVYIKKLRNASKAIALLTEFEANGASDHALRSIKQIYLNLEKIYRKVHTDKELELLKYFMHRDNANKLKDMVQEEVIKHIALWRELSGDVIDVKSVSDLAEGIDRQAIALNKSWNEYQKNFDKNFITPMLMVGAYHDIVRKNAHTARQTLRKYDELRKNKSAVKDESSPFSEDIAILLGSIEADNPGVITDASASVQDLFHITREKLIGQKIDVLLPRIVAKKHDGFIKRYNQESRYDLDTKFDTYIRTIEGHYYPVDVKLKVYPFVSQGLNIISHIKKLRERDLLIIIDPKGVVADCSEDLYDVLNLSKKDLDNCKASDLCPELREVDYALNYLYGVSKEYISQYKDESKIMTSDDKLDLLKEKSEESKHEDEDGEEKEQEQEVEFAKETDEKLAKVSSGLQTLSDKPKLMPAKTMSSHYSPFSQQTSQVHSAARQNAEEVVKKFKKGVKSTFFPRGTARDRHNSAPLDKIEFKIIVVPYTLNGELYKIVKFKNVYFEQNQNPVGLEMLEVQEAAEDEADVSERYDIKLSAKVTAQLSPEPSQDEFAENFPSAKERSFEGHTTDFVEEKVVNIPRKTITVKNAKHAKANRGLTKLEKLQSIFIHHLDEDSFNRSFTKEDQLQFRLYAKGVADDTSSLNYSHKETRIVKALNDLFQKANLRPLTRITVFIVYFAMFAVLVLASVDFVYSSRSFTQMKDGVAIVDSASYRIWNSIVAWQYILILYARSVNLRPLASNPGIVKTSNTKINSSTIAMLQNSADLQNLIQNAGETDIINTFFDNDINLWLPNSNQTVIGGKGSVDSFTAYRVIAQKNIFICNYPQSILLLNGNEDVLFTMNNTVNNLLIRSEGQVTTTEGIVNSIINTNQSLIVVLLTLEMISLGFVVFSLFLVARVIILAYQKLFRVITRIHPENFAHRITELEHVRECLNKNMEARDFTIRVEAASDMTVKQPTKKTGGKQRTHNRFREDKFITKGLVIFTFKFCFIGVILVLGIAGIFLLSFFTADNTFTTLERKNSRLSLTHKLGYTFDMILGNFYYAIIFQNSSKFLMRFNPAGEELDNNLAYLAAANQNLLDVLPDPGKGITDPIIEDFTKNDICKYLNSSLASACDLVTQGGTLGLFGINSKYYADTENYVYLYKQTPTFDYASNLLVNYSATITNSLNVVPAAYQFLRLYLLDDFNNRVTQQNNEGKIIFVIVLVSLAIATTVIQLITIRKFKEIDVGIRKILKIIPFPIIQENRLFGFYLKTEFAKELDSIKQFV